MSLSIPAYPEHPDPVSQPSAGCTSDSKPSEIQPAEATTVTCEDRWQVYHRLQELNIICTCSGFAPLQVQITNPTEAVQLWSVLKRVSLPRKTLAAGLQLCWQLT